MYLLAITANVPKKMCKAYKAREGLGRSMRLEKVKRVGNDGKLEFRKKAGWTVGKAEGVWNM